ncbi:Mitochondrial distribution and morphology protein 12 [Entomophthora muscae]|uniref:Mitochondrial distribution and morphology protein 12 n=2 Tax=Entomophthora muscae TaxID=34485 RepID=A0ACC2T381_9FUNG|nr:Mitochondrial distribution and morphology protein 12 [Entomophthora muscae]
MNLGGQSSPGRRKGLYWVGSRQGLVSFQELNGGRRSPPMGLFSKLLERVRNTMAMEIPRGTLRSAPSSPSNRPEQDRSRHPPQTLYSSSAASSTSDVNKTTSFTSETFSNANSPEVSSSSSNRASQTRVRTPPLVFQEDKISLASDNRPISGFSLASALPSFMPQSSSSPEAKDTFIKPMFSNNNLTTSPVSLEHSFDASTDEPRIKDDLNELPHDSQDQNSSIAPVSASPERLDGRRTPNSAFYQLGDTAQGSATSLFTSRPSDAMAMILRRLQGQGEGINKDYWMKDEHCHSCYNCNKSFTPLFRRKHHCRICGQIFCSDCTSKMIPGDTLGQPGLIRVCDYCHRLRQSYHSAGQLAKSPTGTPSTPKPGSSPSLAHNRTIKDRRQEEGQYSKTSSGQVTPPGTNSEGLKRLLTAGTRVADGRGNSTNPFRQKTGPEDDFALSPVDQSDPIVLDGMETSSEAQQAPEDEDAPYSMISGFKGSILASQSSEGGDLLASNAQRSQSSVWNSLMQQNSTSPNARKLMRKLTITPIDKPAPVAEHKRSKSAYGVQMNIASLQHMRRMLRELLEDHGIPSESGWEDMITSLALKAAHRLELDIRGGDSMDVRRYVKIKRIPGGSPSDSEYVHGVVCTKNLTHKTMLRTLTRPRILILTFPFEYQRVEYQFMSLEPVLAQESEHLKNMVARVLALRPTLVIVEKSIARLALDFLHKANLCVAMNVKPAVIRALARCTQAEVITSLDKLWQEPRLGDCQTFEVRTYMHDQIPGWRKSYFFFHGCVPSRGCTLVLRGAEPNTLAKIKRISELMVYVAYCLKLETVVLRDQLAKIPTQLDPLPPTPPSRHAHPEGRPRSDLLELDVDEMLRPYLTKTLSSSPFVRFPPPYLMLRMKEEAIRVRDLQEKHQHLMASKVANSLSSPRPDDESGPDSQKESAAAVAEHLHTLRAHHAFIESFQPPLSPFAHQSITILHCNVSLAETIICQPPQSHTIEYYQSSDLTLGQFLELSCFDLTMLCGTCDNSVVQHLRSYVHGNARVTVTVEELPSPIAGMENTILMWSYCKKCDKLLPVVPMSEETWKFSLGKYLELAFYHASLSCRAGLCPHDIHRDHVRYFGLNDLAARFEYEPIDIMEVRVPPTKLYFKPEISERLKLQDFDALKAKINAYWDSVSEKVKGLLMYSISAAKPERCRQELTEMARRVNAERSYALQVLQQTQINSHSTDTLALNLVLRVMQEKVVEWDAEFASVTQRYLQTERDLRRLTTHQLRRLFPDQSLGTEPANHDQFLREMEGPAKIAGDAFPTLSNSPSTTPTRLSPSELDSIPSRQTYVPIMDASVYRRHSLKLMREERAQREERSLKAASPLSHNPITPLPTGDKPAEDYLSAGSRRFVPRAMPSFGHAAHLTPTEDPKAIKASSSISLPRPGRSTSARIGIPPRVQIHTPQVTPQGTPNRPPAPAASLLSTPTSARFRGRLGTRAVERRLSERGTRPSPTTPRNSSDRRTKRSNTIVSTKPLRPTIAVYLNARDAVEEESDSEEEPSTTGAYPGLEVESDYMGVDPVLGFLGEDPSPNQVLPTPSQMPEITRDDEPLPPTKPTTPPPEAVKEGGYDRGSIIQTLSTLLGGPSSMGLVPLEYPLQPTEHLFPDSPIVIREDEPSSVIAFTLSSQDYLEQMQLIRQTSPPASPERAVERDLQTKVGTHLRYQLGEGAIRVSCKVFFAHHFDALRRHCDQEALFVESLARCVKWSASGGKSGSIFLKTRDDRLVMKEVSKAELDAFLKFAPIYFSHMAEALFEGLPALLAKIFGLYRISIKNVHSGRSMRIDVLIMENLFYERRISRIFDLKGSMRNRHVQSTGKENEVLLDENLMEIICRSPIFIRAHAKQLLHMAIFNDTKFLSSLKVMDYSLLVGFDEERKELVVGMVDFIRTFTWDKKLESWVKETGFLGGGGEQPTIVSPSNYKHRFRAFMDKYFLMVPDKYYIPSIELKLPRASNN